MVRLRPKLERRIDNYAILYCFYNNKREVNRKVVQFIRRVPGLNKKRRYASLMYYRKQRLSCEAVKRGLEGFARSYEGMDEEEGRQHDEQALSFITTVFSQEVDNVFYLIDYYHQKKGKQG